MSNLKNINQGDRVIFNYLNNQHISRVLNINKKNDLYKIETSGHEIYYDVPKKAITLVENPDESISDDFVEKNTISNTEQVYKYLDDITPNIFLNVDENDSEEDNEKINKMQWRELYDDSFNETNNKKGGYNNIKLELSQCIDNVLIFFSE